MNQELETLMAETDTAQTTNRRSWKLGAAGLLLAIAAAAIGTYQVNKFFETHRIVFQSPVRVRIQTPVYVARREKPAPEIREVQAAQHTSPLTAEQQYLCDKFGPNCKTMLAIQRAENKSGSCDAINWSNKDQSLDIGYLQINTLWINKQIFKPAQLFDCKTNIDAGYEIFKRWGGEKDPAKGFGAWTTFNNGDYKKYLIN